MVNQIGEQELKIIYNNETQHLILKINNVIVEYEKENNSVSKNKTINEKLNISKKELALKDLQLLLTKPNEISLLIRKGYNSVIDINEDKGKFI